MRLESVATNCCWILPNLAVPAHFDALVQRRLQSEPVAHILGTKEFWGLKFQVSPDVLIPRPDSETLIEEALRLFAGNPPGKILDLGTGSGRFAACRITRVPAGIRNRDGCQYRSAADRP